MTARNVAIANLGAAVAEVMNLGIAELTDEKKIAVAQALVSGAAEIRVVFIPSTQTVVAGLYAADRSVKPQELFRIDASSPSEKFN